MRLHVLATITAAIGLSLPALAPASAQAPDGMTCQSVIANAERSKAEMAIASGTYFHGIFMGQPCVEVDYVKAFDLATRSGRGVEPFLRILRERAAEGHPRAKSALEKLGY
jgi:hypothetical protein